MTVEILLVCLAAGAACGLSDGAVSTLLRRRHVAFTVICDVVLAAVLVGSHTLISYLYCDGIFFPYAICAQIVGFLLLRLISSKITQKLIAALSPRIAKMQAKRKAQAEERKRKKLQRLQKAQ